MHKVYLQILPDLLGWAPMKPFFLVMLLNLIFVSLSFGSECTIPGLKKAPQSISCEFRDGWYIKNFYRIECVNGKYLYRQETRQSIVGNGPIVSATLVPYDSYSDGPLVMNFMNNEGMGILLVPRIGKLYRGEIHYGLDLNRYDLKAHCRVE